MASFLEAWRVSLSSLDFRRLATKRAVLGLACVLALRPFTFPLRPFAPPPLRIAIAQIGIVSRWPDNLQKILEYIDKAADEQCRVVVFPEGALRELKAPDHPETLAALETVSQAAARRKVYVMLGVFSAAEAGRRGFNWMVVFDPDGRELFRYTKLYDRRDSPLPRVFYIDGIPCTAIICADRWLRAVEDLPVMDGAQVSFELSDNFESEWVPELGWYWYVARALRNNIYVVFANSATTQGISGRHGHSAVIDPEGGLAAATYDACEQLVISTIDISRATRAEAERRRTHQAFKEFWDRGARLREGKPVRTAGWKRYESPEIPLTIAVAQVLVSTSPDHNLAHMEQVIREAAGHGADVVAFPLLSLKEEALPRIQEAAKERGLCVIFAMSVLQDGRQLFSAFAIGPDGRLLTRYDQPVRCPARMWFRLKGVPAVLTIGHDALWNEIAELAASAGAQLLFNLSGPDPVAGNLAVQASFASFRTLTTFVCPAGRGGSRIWDDLGADEEIRAAVNQTRLAPKGTAPALHASFAANCVVQAGPGEEIIYATRTVNRENPFREDSKNPQMKPWYSFGAQTITGCGEEPGAARE
ncbi:MAG: carbon-nitrogen hydrolase family protein [Acidobacteriota bacterium]